MISQIRVKSVCVFWKGDSILVAEGFDKVKDESFYTPLGGKVEFGEYGHQTIEREIKEEIASELTNLWYIGTLENIFKFEGRQGHEIVLVYYGDLKDKSLYDKAVIEGFEKTPEYHGRIRAVWKPLSSFDTKSPLYPEGLLKMLRAQSDSSRYKPRQ